MTVYGEIDIIRELLDIDAGQEEEKIVRLRGLSNTWLGTFAPDSVLSTLSTAIKNLAVNYHTVYLFRLSSDSLSGEMGGATFRWKDEGKEILEQAILRDGAVFEIYKVNDP